MHVVIDCPGYGTNYLKASREPTMAGASTALLPEIRWLVHEIDPTFHSPSHNCYCVRNDRVGESIP
jgi:hypothetical protein